MPGSLGAAQVRGATDQRGHCCADPREFCLFVSNSVWTQNLVLSLLNVLSIPLQHFQYSLSWLVSLLFGSGFHALSLRWYSCIFHFCRQHFSSLVLSPPQPGIPTLYKYTCSGAISQPSLFMDRVANSVQMVLFSKVCFWNLLQDMICPSICPISCFQEISFQVSWLIVQYQNHPSINAQSRWDWILFICHKSPGSV